MLLTPSVKNDGSLVGSRSVQTKEKGQPGFLGLGCNVRPQPTVRFIRTLAVSRNDVFYSERQFARDPRTLLDIKLHSFRLCCQFTQSFVRSGLLFTAGIELAGASSDIWTTGVRPLRSYSTLFHTASGICHSWSGLRIRPCCSWSSLWYDLINSGILLG